MYVFRRKCRCQTTVLQAADTILDASIEDTATPVREADAKVSSKLLIDNGFIDPDNNCELCTRMVYTPGSKSEAGIAYKDDTVDLGNAQRIVFFAKGEQAQEVSFVERATLLAQPILTILIFSRG